MRALQIVSFSNAENAMLESLSMWLKKYVTFANICSPCLAEEMCTFVSLASDECYCLRLKVRMHFQFVPYYHGNPFCKSSL